MAGRPLDCVKDTARMGGRGCFWGRPCWGRERWRERQGRSDTPAPLSLLLDRGDIGGMGEESAGQEGPPLASGLLNPAACKNGAALSS